MSHMRLTLAGLLVGAWILAGCDRDSAAKDPHLVPTPDLREDSTFLSPPILQYPLYACAQSVVVRGFVPGAKLEIFLSGGTSPIGGTQSWLSGGQNVNVTPAFVAGQKVIARQTFNGATSGPSNEVTVTSHTEDYPNGLPKPRLAPVPCLECGRAVGITDVVPGAWVKVFSEKALGGGAFAAPVEIGGVSDFPYAFVSPAFEKDARIHAESGLCTDRSAPSDPAIVQAEPASIPAPKLDPIQENVNIAVVWGPGGPPNLPLNGANLEVFSNPGTVKVGGQPTPGGGGQQVFINPKASTANQYLATQALCTRSPPSDSVPVVPCAQQPPATIKPPIPGDTQIEVITFIPGSEILVFADGVEIGDGGGPVVQLSQPVAEGQTIIVLQKVGDCRSSQVYQIPVQCSLGGDGRACSSEWPAFRHNALRNGTQPNVSVLSNPYLVKKLAIVGRYPATGSVGAFRASPVVHGGRVFVGSGDGHIYAFDAATGGHLWQYPPAGQPALLTSYANQNPSSRGIAASAMIAAIPDRGDAVIFAAPDRSVGSGLGSGRLFAIRVTDGTEIWKSPELARLTGTTSGSTSELHENHGYSAPLALGRLVYVGIGDHADSPIQKGRVVAVRLTDGQPASGFGFEATNTRGGGIWSSIAGGLTDDALYVTTGNSRAGGGPPNPNHGLSLLRLDPQTGTLVWKLQPVPYDMDNDPDWAAGAHLLSATCGQVVVSTMKDGWSYAANAASPGAPAASLRWQFPPTGFFSPGDGTAHGDTRYLVPGAAWNDVFFTMTGGENVVSQVNSGFGRIHALNVCAGGGGRVRWTADIPSATLGQAYQMGPPSITRGIVYVGTAAGHLVALADPSAWPTQGSRCSRPDISNTDCAANGYSLVPIPSVLRDLNLAGGTIRTEPVLAGGRVYVATEQGVVFIIEPRP